MAPYMKVMNHVIGKKYLPSIPTWMPSFLCYGAAFVGTVCYFADIQQVMKYVPIYNEAFKYPYEDDKRIFITPRFEN